MFEKDPQPPGTLPPHAEEAAGPHGAPRKALPAHGPAAGWRARLPLLRPFPGLRGDQPARGCAQRWWSLNYTCYGGPTARRRPSCHAARPAVLRGRLCLGTPYESSWLQACARCRHLPPLGTPGPAALPCQRPAHPPAVDADRDAVVRLVAANVANELQDGVDGRGDVVVWPVSVVELVDGANFLQEEKSAGRGRGHRGAAAAAGVGAGQDTGTAAAVLQTSLGPSASMGKGWGAVCSCSGYRRSTAIL